MDRRNFLAGSAAVPLMLNAAAKREIPKRRYKDNVQLSIIGFGGIVVVGQDQTAADRQVAASFDRGVNYYDVAPSYGDGEAEIKLGIALKPYRGKVFLACKTQKRDAAGAQQELERSLKRLHTDHFDLYQFHAVSSMKDVEQILAPGGAAEVYRKAKQEGKARYLGLSAHHEDAAIALMKQFPCDSVLFPLNYAAVSSGKFGLRILDHAKQNQVARLALKGMAKGRWAQDAKRDDCKKCWYEPVADPQAARQALRYTLSEDVTAAIPPGDERLYELALDIASAFQPLSAAERKQLLAGATGIDPIFKS